MACSSKKLLVGSIFSHVAWEGPVVVLDFPKEGENSTFNDFTKFLEDRDVYFDILTWNIKVISSSKNHQARSHG